MNTSPALVATYATASLISALLPKLAVGLSSAFAPAAKSAVFFSTLIAGHVRPSLPKVKWSPAELLTSASKSAAAIY